MKVINSETFNSKMVSTYGRTFYDTKNQALGLGFTLSGFKVTFVGTSLFGKFVSKHFDTSYDCPYIAIFVDEEFPNVDSLNKAKMVKLTNEMVLVSGLPYGKHTVIIRKLSEANGHELLVKELITDGEFKENAQSSKRYSIEFFGDSLTAGLGMLGSLKDPQAKTSEQNALIGYPMLTCASLNAECSIVAVSGFPMGISPYSGDSKVKTVPGLFSFATFAPELGENELPKWNNKDHQPDLVIVNLGANDRNYRNKYPEQEQFCKDLMEQKYHEFLDVIEKNYPNAKILMLSFHLYMRQGFDEVVKKVYEKRDHSHIYQLTISPKGRPSFGTAWHPTKIMNKKYSDKLVEFIKENIL